MKFFKRLFLVLLMIFAMLALASQFLPAAYHLERSIVIHARPEAIYPRVASLKRWPEWSAWSAVRFPKMQYTYEGPELGVGAISRWTDPSGDGRMKLTTADPAAGVSFDMEFNHGKFQARGALIFNATGETTRVTWTHDGRLSRNPLERYAGLMLERMLAPDLEAGLQKLKATVEAAKQP